LKTTDELMKYIMLYKIYLKNVQTKPYSVLCKLKGGKAAVLDGGSAKHSSN